MTTTPVQSSRAGQPRHDGDARDAVTRFAFWFFAITLILGLIELSWRLLTL